MSNFDFMNHQDFLKHPTCKVLYENAILAENAYFSDHEKCALKVRFILEQLCIFVSEFRHANYPEPVYMLGMYWGRENRFEFLRVFNQNNVALIKETNSISCSFLHSEMPTREDVYPKMLQNIYELLLWLYKELGLKTKQTNADYSEEKIPVNENEHQDEEDDILYSSEKLMQDFKKFFPNCNTDGLCNIERKGDKYIVTDLSGKKIDEMVVPEALEYSERQVNQLKQQLSNKKEEFDSAKEEFLKIQYSQESKIRQLEQEVDSVSTDRRRLSSEQSRRINELNREIMQMKRDKRNTAEQYKQKLNHLGGQFNDLQDKYEALLPVEEQRNQLKNQVKSLIEEREQLKNHFSQKQGEMLEEIKDVKQRLETAQKHMKELNLSAKESDSLIHELKTELAYKEKELQGEKQNSQRIFSEFQSESKETLTKYKSKVNNLEIIVTRLMMENKRFKERMEEQDTSGKIKGYLQIVNQGIMKMNEGYALHNQNPNMQKLREYLLYVKNYYDSEISELEKELSEKNRELQEEKERYNDLLHSLYEAEEVKADSEQNVYEEGRTEEKKKRKKPILQYVFAGTSVCAVLLAVFLIQNREDVHDRRSEQKEYSQVAMSEGQEEEMLSSEENDYLTKTDESDMKKAEVTTEIVTTEFEEATETGESIEEEYADQDDKKEEQVSEEGDNGKSYSEDALNELLEKTKQAVPPDNYNKVPGINDKLIEEIDTLDKQSVFAWNEDTKRDDMYYVGRAKVPGMGTNGSRILFMGLNEKNTLCNMNQNEVIQFAFLSGHGIGYIVVATEVENLSSQLSRDSTIEDVKAVLGNKMTEAELEEPTIFADAKKETAVMFRFEKANAAIICFGEDGKVCDYAYIGISGIE